MVYHPPPPRRSFGKVLLIAFVTYLACTAVVGAGIMCVHVLDAEYHVWVARGRP